ncbi:peptidylprolyl isomerase [Candidatus Berkelbacteria bacterium]|nr:peptidylprolyl isomerase [Candidatus Berkelbacteria bacterium]
MTYQPRLAAVAVALALVLTGCKGDTVDQTNQSRTYANPPGKLPAEQIEHKQATLTTNKGLIRIELFGAEAPLTVSNFVFLARDHFYDGLTFHRVEPGFVIQGGDPNGNGTGGPGYTFDDEPVKRPYTRGTVAMANSGPNTNGSQFFIVLADTQLPPAYTIFGTVLEGMDAVDQIQVGDTIQTVQIMDAQ